MKRLLWTMCWCGAVVTAAVLMFGCATQPTRTYTSPYTDLTLHVCDWRTVDAMLPNADALADPTQRELWIPYGAGISAEGVEAPDFYLLGRELWKFYNPGWEQRTRWTFSD